MIKQVFYRNGPLNWLTIRPFLDHITGCSFVAIGLDIEAGNELAVLRHPNATPLGEYVVWPYLALLEANFDSWLFWLTLHFFDSNPKLQPLIGEDADLFLDPTYRQNCHAKAEFYVWDASEVVLISETEIGMVPGWLLEKKERKKR